jgi:glutamate-1-semialdehyde 2,1-aminomutase
VLVCGYHGWQDWYIGSTARSSGVPQATRDLTHTFTYNDIDSLRALFAEHRDEVACVIMEPMNVVEPEQGFLQDVADLTRANGAVCVFDETITGFRYANGGAQEYFGVTPDLATFGKGLANGYPVSAVAGRADIMKLMEEVFFSFTFGGETLSLAAAIATMDKLKREPVVAKTAEQGAKIVASVRDLITTHGCGDFLAISGHPTWSFLLMSDTEKASSWELKTVFEQELFARGVLGYGTHNMSYAHTDADVAALLAAYGDIFPLMRQATESGAAGLLTCEPLQPLFKVR